MNQQRLTYLLEQYIDDTATDMERQELEMYLNNESNADLFSHATADLLTRRSFAGSELPYVNLAQRVLQVDKSHQLSSEELPPGNFKDQFTPSSRVSLLKMAWFRYAAAVVIMLTAGAYFLFQNDQEQPLTSHKQIPAEIKPGRQGAILTLADGSQLILDSLKDGIIAEQNGSKVQLQNGSMSYTANEESTAEMVYNTLATPKGRQFAITLPDGSTVRLNAASSITYPTAFVGKSRTVQIKGEAYFDVSPDAKRPFIVQSNDISIEVLGTEFNINNYDNENNAQITLVNGLVKLVDNSPQYTDKRGSIPPSKLLHPGQQATINRERPKTDPIKITESPGLDQVTAWKDGLFNFNRVDLFNLMRQLERWYDIEVEYNGDVENIKFRGKMYRNVNLSDVLEELRKMDISIEQRGNKVIVNSIK